MEHDITDMAAVERDSTTATVEGIAVYATSTTTKRLQAAKRATMVAATL